MKYTSPFMTAWGRQRTQQPMTSPFWTAWGRQTKETPGYTPPKPAAGSAATVGGSDTSKKELPVDPAYDKIIAAQQQRRDDTEAGLTNEKVGTLANYGYGATFDDKGEVTDLTFDPANPFSRAALLRRNYQQAKTGTQNSMAARGQLYSGALLNAQDTNDFGYLQGEDALQKALRQALGNILNRRRIAGTDFDLAAGQAYGDRLGRAFAQDTGQ